MARFGFPAFPATAHGQYLAASYIASLGESGAEPEPQPGPAEIIGFSSAVAAQMANSPLIIGRPEGAIDGDFLVLAIRGQANVTGAPHFSNSDWEMVTEAYAIDNGRRFSEVFVHRIEDADGEDDEWTFDKPAGYSGNRLLGAMVLLRGIHEDGVIGVGGPVVGLTYPGHDVDSVSENDITLLFGGSEFAASQSHAVDGSPEGWESLFQVVAPESGDTGMGRTVLRALYRVGGTPPGEASISWAGIESSPVTMAVTLRSVS